MELHLFDAFGIELEYMIVDGQSLNVMPISHHLLSDHKGNVVSDVERGPISWSNELTHHVIELKTSSPVPKLNQLSQLFQQSIVDVSQRLEQDSAMLLPTGMHPWMNPDQELHLWPFDYSPVYHAFHKAFDCRGHGWANLQSMHINLPFCGDEEFGRLHAAIRLVLPLLPAIAASSPFVDGKFSDFLDNRLQVYANNSRSVPSISGRVIPENVFTQAEYQKNIFEPMYRDISPLDPEGLLQDEFLNARGAIARFDRGAIEIRVIDVQECPQADIAIAALTISLVKSLVEEKWSTYDVQQQGDIEQLRTIFDAVVKDADQATIKNGEFLKHFGVDASSISLAELWRHIRSECSEHLQSNCPEVGPSLDVILGSGPLSRRVIRSVGEDVNRDSLHVIYGKLASCLKAGEMFCG